LTIYPPASQLAVFFRFGDSNLFESPAAPLPALRRISNFDIRISATPFAPFEIRASKFEFSDRFVEGRFSRPAENRYALRLVTAATTPKRRVLRALSTGEKVISHEGHEGHQVFVLGVPV
jgi:hypothetical protein